MEAQVLIVGAGPTGLMLASQLARRGVRALVIDRHSGPAQQTRAMAVQARTLEIYSKLGIADRALALGERATGANMWASGRWTARIPIGDIRACGQPVRCRQRQALLCAASSPHGAGSRGLKRTTAHA